jgi:hypothetical protein
MDLELSASYQAVQFVEAGLLSRLLPLSDRVSIAAGPGAGSITQTE